MPEHNEKTAAKDEEKTRGDDASFYTGELPDPIVRSAYDPFNGQDPATLLASLIGDDEEGGEEEHGKKRPALLPLILASSLLLICAAVFLLRAPRAYPQMQPKPTPTPTLAPKPAKTSTQGVFLPLVSAQIEPVSQAPTSYERTALVVDGKTVGVLVSREAAEALLKDVCDYYEALVRENYEVSGTLSTQIENEIEFVSAPETEDAALSAAELLFETLTGKNTRLDVISTQESREEEIISAKEKENSDKYLLKGTSIIEDPGCDGSVLKISSVTYKNGKKRKESEQEETTETEARERVVRVGTQKITDEDAPGKNEGKKGKKSEELRFHSPVENGKIISNYGQRNGVLHLGLDYAAAEDGAPCRVLASCAGTVVCKMERGGYGLMLEIDHGEGFVTRYAHLQEAPLKVGEHVETGDAIGIMGDSGNTDGVRLHFELRIDGEAYNPRFYLE